PSVVLSVSPGSGGDGFAFLQASPFLRGSSILLASLRKSAVFLMAPRLSCEREIDRHKVGDEGRPARATYGLGSAGISHRPGPQLALQAPRSGLDGHDQS